MNHGWGWPNTQGAGAGFLSVRREPRTAAGRKGPVRRRDQDRVNDANTAGPNQNTDSTEADWAGDTKYMSTAGGAMEAASAAGVLTRNTQ